MEGLSLDNILSEDQIGTLFSDEEVTQEEQKDTDPDEIPDNIIEPETTESTPEELFGETESVGSEEETKDERDTTSTSDTSSDFYSSIANALVEDGILQNLDEESLSKIKTPEDLAEAISAEVRSQMDERQKRIDEALNVGVNPTEIQKYERFIGALENITEDKLTDESDEGETLRKNIIYQDYINKGYSNEKAIKMVDRSIKAGTDIEDAREALEDNKTFYKGKYKALVDSAKKEAEEEQKKLRKQAETLKKSILEEEKAFGDVTIDKNTRQRVYESICKPVYTDPDSGERLTAIQKYEMENRTEFLKNIGLLFVLTDGFKNINRLVDNKVKQETKKSLRKLEHTLTSRGNTFNGGNLSFANNSGDNDPESLFKGWKLSV